MEKKILYVDMDGVLVDLETEINKYFILNPDKKEKYKDCPDEIPGLFSNPSPIQYAIDSIRLLYKSGKYDLFILTTAPWNNPYSNSEKRLWVERYFGDIFYKKIIITHRKDLLKGHYLIDDRLKNGADLFDGELLHFGYDYENKKLNEYPDWDSILNYLL